MNSSVVKIEIPSHPRYCDIARMTVSAVALECGFNEQETDDIRIAVSEACINVIQHAYDEELHPLILTFTTLENELQILIQDHGKGFDVESMKAKAAPISVDNPKTSGLGLYIIQSLMDGVEVNSLEGHGSSIAMVKKLRR